MHSVCLPSPPCVLVQQLTGSAQGSEIACCMLTSFWITRKVVLLLFPRRKELAIVARPRTPKLLVARRSAKARERSPEHLHLDRRQSRLQGLWVEDGWSMCNNICILFWYRRIVKVCPCGPLKQQTIVQRSAEVSGIFTYLFVDWGCGNEQWGAVENPNCNFWRIFWAHVGWGWTKVCKVEGQ